MNGRERGAVHRRLSRETRHLLIAVLVAVAALWVLARVRFPDRPVTPNPIPPLLTQLAARPGFADLESEIARTQSRLSRSLLVWPPASLGAAAWRAPGAPRPALRLRGDAAAVLLPRASYDGSAPHPDLLAADPATGLAIVRTPAGGVMSLPGVWVPESLDISRFLAAAHVSSGRVTLRPFFVSALSARRTPAWSGAVWTLAPPDDVRDGSLVFTVGGDLVGALVAVGSDRAIVPAETLLADAQRLLERARTAQGDLGIEAQPLTPALAAAARASTGVMVSFVHPRSGMAPYVSIGDVIVALNGVPLETWEQWDVRSKRLTAGEPVVLHVRRGGQPRRVEILAPPAVPAGEPPPGLGLLLRNVAGAGSEVVVVEPGSAAALAGLRPGDLITMFGPTHAPTPAQVRRAFAAAGASGGVLVGVTRNGSHLVLALMK
jgi:S1-C subfamily serine protease